MLSSSKSEESNMSNTQLDDSTNVSKPAKSESADKQGISSDVLTVDVSVAFIITEPTGWLLELSLTNDNVI